MEKITIILFLLCGIFVDAWGQTTKEKIENCKFFITNGDTVRYHSKYTWKRSNVEWLMNERTRLHALVDSNLNVLTDFKYSMASAFYPTDNCVPASRDGKWGMVDKKGNEIMEFEYYEPYSMNCFDIKNKDFFLFEKRNVKGVVDTDGNIIIPFNKWEKISYHNYSIFQLKKGRNYYLYSMKTGKTVSLKHNFLKYNFDKEGKAVLWNPKFKKYGVIDTTGMVIQPCIYTKEEAMKLLK